MEYLDRIAEGYEGLLGESLQEKSQKRINWICDQVQGSRVLDIGCSQGICEVLLGRRGFQVTGIDIAEESIAYARKLIDKEPFDVRLRVQLICADFVKEAGLEEIYDTILLTEILEHLEHPEEMVAKAAECLCGGGRMIVTVPFGINDFPDHKQTFYMADIGGLLSKWVRIDHVEFMSGWIGFCCTKSDSAAPFEQVDRALILQEEQAFFALERPLRDGLKDLSERAKKIKTDYETMKSWYEAEKENRKNQEQQLIKIQSMIAETEGALQKSDEAVHNLNIALQKSDEIVAELKKSLQESNDAVTEQRALLSQSHKDKSELELRVQVLNKQCKSTQQELEKMQIVNGKLLRERDLYSERYTLLANAKLGKITLKYWKLKDWFIAKFRSWHVTGWKWSNSRKQLPQNVSQHTIIKTDAELPSISVVIPTYKDNPYIKQAIESVLQQNYPPEKIQVILSVNGNNITYYDALCEQYKDEDRVTVIHTTHQGAGAARNYAISYVTSDCITFLDDDDYFEVDYLRSMAQHMTGTVTMVVGCFVDFHQDSNIYQKENYINQVLRTVGEKTGSDYEQIGSLLSTICGKLYKFSQWTQFKPIDETLRNTEDVVFWADNCELLEGSYYTCGCRDNCAYTRRVVDASLSRPKYGDHFTFYIQDRLAVIERLSDALIASKTEKARNFIRGKIDTQTRFMEKAFGNFSVEEKCAAVQCIQQSTALFLNRSKFGLQRGIAFCHNFSPTADPSAYVAAKRLDQISEKEGLINWTVISADMRNCRKTDEQFDRYYARYRYSNRIVVGKKAYFNEKAQYIWGRQAYEAAETENIDNVSIIYSRSMWAGSHIAAYLYKTEHPGVKWYAEFSDPLYMDRENTPRKSSQIFEDKDEELNDFWFNVEKIVYENADVIIYTNDNQREYMLGYYPEKDVCKSVYDRSLVMNHPTISHRYCNLFSSDLKLDPKYINIAYFGTFYTSRRADGLWALLKDERVMLHLFISDSGDMKDMEELPERVQLHQTLKHFEFLNVASKMDYLAIIDSEFPIPEINPYLPSKLADYLTSGTPIIAFINKGSPLSKMNHPSIVKLQKGDDVKKVFESHTH